jgi:hypothetical protein
MFTESFFDELEKIALTLRGAVASGTARSAAGHSLFRPTGQSSGYATRANLANVGRQDVAKRNIPPIEERAKVPSHQLSRNQIGQAFHAKKSFESPNTFKGFTPATTSGAKPLNSGAKADLKSRLVGSYRDRHGIGPHVSDQNVTGRMLNNNELARRRTARAMFKGK